MRSSTGRPVSGDDFFNREAELKLLEDRARDFNHVLLTGQRRMGKTSVTRELGRRLVAHGWVFLPADVQGATCAEDVISTIAERVHINRTMARRFAVTMKRWVEEGIDEVSAYDFRLRIRTALDSGNWRRHGEQLLRVCASHDQPVLLVIDELPIFLQRMLYDDSDIRRVDEFLSWLRGVLQDLSDSSLFLIVSGSIGLAPLVRRLGIPDRINHLATFRLPPWSRETSVECIECLADSYELNIHAGVASAVYDALGLGIPQHVQSFFARLRDFATMHGRKYVTVDDVDVVYRNELLGPSGQNDLVHYEARLREGLDEETYRISMEILAEAATQDVFTDSAQRSLERLYSTLVEDSSARIVDALEVLTHDGYLESADGGYRFSSRFLKDWWSARFREHHIPLGERPSERSIGFR